MRPSASSEIYNVLKQEIINLYLVPGQLISETEMVKRFGVSRTPIRDVFKRLELDRLIRIVPQKGTFISPINLSKIIDFIFMREKIEIGIVEELLQMTNRHVLELLEVSLMKQKILIENTEIETSTKAKEFYELDNQFHKTLFSALNKETIWETFSDIMPDYNRFRAVSSDIHTEENLVKLYQTHQNIYKYIKNHNLDELRKLYSHHINPGNATIEKLLNTKKSYFA